MFINQIVYPNYMIWNGYRLFNPFLCYYTIVEMDYELVNVDYGFVSKKIGTSYWTRYRANILWIPTGCGKTTFIMDLIEEAKRLDKTVLIVSNRIATDIAIKCWIADMLGLYSDTPAEQLRDIDVFGNVTILTYQKLPKYMKNCESKPYYAVFDEAHYFTSDATFSSGNGYLINEIPWVFQDSIRVYMSATMEDVLGYICKAECTDKAKRRFAMHRDTGWLWHNSGFNNALYEGLLSNTIIPIVYKMEPDFSHIDLKFVMRDADVEDIIRNSNDKSIVFVDNADYGKSLKDSIGDAIYMDRHTKDKHPEVLNEIIKNESFDAKILITTSVFCNGCNIKDLGVKNVIILCTDPTEIIQMVGRVRKISDDQRLNVYIKVIDERKLDHHIKDINNILGLIDLRYENPQKFAGAIIDSAYSYNLIKGIAYPDREGRFSFDWLTKSMLKRRLAFCNRLKNALQADGTDGYCKIYAELFNKEYFSEMLINVAVDNFCTWLDSWVDKPLGDKFYNVFKEKFCRIFKDIKKENRLWRRDACNNRLLDKELPYRIDNIRGEDILRSVQNA